MHRRSVAITGLGAVTPLGYGAQTMHERWAAGESGIADRFGRCEFFDATEHLAVKQARRTDRYTQFAIVAAREALEGGQWGEGPYDPLRVGCIMGTGVGGLQTLEDQHDVLLDRGPERVSPLAVPMMMANAGAGVLAIEHGIRGPCWGVVSACAAGANAIGSAARLIRRGEVDACVAGGAEAGITPFFVAAFEKLGALSPSGVPRPFDANRDGYVMGEGAAVMLLEDEERARERGAPILGRLTGYGASADAHHLTAPEPTGRGAATAMTRAMRDAGVRPEDVAYVNAHGTATALNDPAETAAIKLALGEAAANVPVSSLKSSIGHLLGAAGAAEAIATLMALRAGVAPPTLNHEEPDEGLDLNYVPREAQPLALNGTRVGLSNAFGFGGHNAVLALEAA